MNRPDNMLTYDENDLKLGIKSSLPNVKSTVSLAILLWECTNHPSELSYSSQLEGEIVIKEELKEQIVDSLKGILDDEGIKVEDLVETINQNQLFKSQLEALIVAFELIWKLAKISFEDSRKPASAERTGGIRYTKKISYSLNIDIIHNAIRNNMEEYYKILLSWMGFKITVNKEYEQALLYLLTVLSEGAIYKLVDGEKDVIFNGNSIYTKLLETAEPIDINGDKEAKGSLRILKSMLSEGMNPYLNYSAGKVTISDENKNSLVEYQKRVDTLLRLYGTKVIGIDESSSNTNGISTYNLEENRIKGGTNVLLYGVPGSGKSHTIKTKYCKDADEIERVVFHPDYTYGDFVGQILPITDADTGRIRYEFTAGPFTRILSDAYNNPTRKYCLIIEEINRGNAPAIFGDIFQLLDRDENGNGSYEITNADIASKMYIGDQNLQKVKLPSNLFIFATMNTSDQNVFTLDTAFQRRWNMRMVENDVFKSKWANNKILDTTIKWADFANIINNLIITKNVGLTSSEDKRLGAYFVTDKDLYFFTTDDGITQEEADDRNSNFPEKVLKYLWDDAFKFVRDEVFNSEFDSLEKLIKAFESADGNERFTVFADDLFGINRE